jgi:hypothetical protein
MKKLFLILLLLIGRPAYSATLVVHTIQGSPDGAGFTTSPGIDTTNANFIALAITENLDPGCTIADNKGNTYVIWVNALSTVESVLRIYRVNSDTPAVGVGHTWTVGGGSCVAPAVAIQAWSGATAAAIDQSSSNALTNVMTLKAGSISPTTPDNVVMSALGHFITGTQAIDSGFTISDQVAFVPGSSYGLAFAYKIQTTATPADPQWTLASTTSPEAINVDIKTVAAATGPKQGSLITLGVGK